MKIFLIILLFAGNYYNVVNISSKNTLPQDSPFILKRKSPYTVLPDSLGGKKTHGLAVVQITLDKNIPIKMFTILKLKIKGNNQLNYSYPQKITKQVFRYIPFFKEYAQQTKIEKNVFYHQYIKENKISFIVRF